MKTKTAYTINRDGEVVPGNGFKQPTPTTAMNNNSGIWMHSIDRTDSANPVSGILILAVTVAIGWAILKYMA